MKKILNAIPILCLIIFSATTYIVKDGEKELERFVLEDGASGEKEIQYKEFLAMSEKADEQDKKEAVETEKAKSGSQEPAFWTVEGRLVDLLHLKPLPAGEIFFISATGTIQTGISKEQNFSVKLPVSKDSFWMVKVHPPAGYAGQVFLYQKGHLEKIPFKERLKFWTSIYTQHGIRSSISDLDIALFPLSLTPEEEKQYHEIMTAEAAPVIAEDPAEVEEIKKQSVLFRREEG